MYKTKIVSWVLILVILSALSSSVAAGLGNTYMRVEDFKYTYKISGIHGVNYFIYSGDGFIGYYHVSDICGCKHCRFKPIVSVASFKSFSQIRVLEDRVIDLLREKCGLEIPYRGSIYLVNNSVRVIVLPVIQPGSEDRLERAISAIEPIAHSHGVIVVVKLIPRSLVYDPSAVDKAVAKLVPILDTIYNVSNGHSQPSKLSIELEKALKGVNGGKLPGISFSGRYKAFGCLGIVLDGVRTKPSRESVESLFKVLRDIIGYSVPIVIEADQESPVPLGNIPGSLPPLNTSTSAESNVSPYSTTSSYVLPLLLGISALAIVLCMAGIKKQ